MSRIRCQGRQSGVASLGFVSLAGRLLPRMMWRTTSNSERFSSSPGRIEQPSAWTGVDHRMRGAEWCILLLAIVLRLVTLGDKPMWEDEAWTFHSATAPEGLVTVSGLDPHPLSFYALYRILPSWFLESDFAFRLPSAVFSCLAVVMMAKLLRLTVVDPRIRLGSLALFAVLPISVRYSYEARAYAPAQLASILVLWGYVRAWQRPGWGRWLRLAGCAAFSAHLDGFGLAAPFAVLLHALMPVRRHAPARWAGVAVIVGALMAAPYYVFRLSYMIHSGGVHEIDASSNLWSGLTGRIVELSPFGIGFNQLSTGHHWLIHVIAVGVVIAAAAAIRTPRSTWAFDSRKLFAILVIVTPLVYLILSMALQVNLMHKKYLIVTVAGWAPLMVAGVSHLARSWRGPALIAMIAISLCVSVRMLMTPGDRADWRALVGKMASRMSPGDRYLHEMQANYPMYSFGPLRAYACRAGMMLAGDDLMEYRPRTSRHDVEVSVVDPAAWHDANEPAGLMAFAHGAETHHVWTISADWMTRGRTLDLSGVARAIMTFSADGVAATLWETKPIGE